MEKAIIELPDSGMAFKLQDGSILMISKADIKEIATRIIVEGSLIKNVVLFKEEDSGIKKADRLYEILKAEKDMKPEIREKYLKQISSLIGDTDRHYKSLTDGEVYKINEVA